jgi:hypothetical protein
MSWPGPLLLADEVRSRAEMSLDLTDEPGADLFHAALSCN